MQTWQRVNGVFALVQLLRGSRLGGGNEELHLMWKAQEKIDKSDTEGAIKCFGKAEGL